MFYFRLLAVCGSMANPVCIQQITYGTSVPGHINKVAQATYLLWCCSDD